MARTSTVPCQDTDSLLAPSLRGLVESLADFWPAIVELQLMIYLPFLCPSHLATYIRGCSCHVCPVFLTHSLQWSAEFKALMVVFLTSCHAYTPVNSRKLVWQLEMSESRLVCVACIDIRVMQNSGFCDRCAAHTTVCSYAAACSVLQDSCVVWI